MSLHRNAGSPPSVEDDENKENAAGREETRRDEWVT